MAPATQLMKLNLWASCRTHRPSQRRTNTRKCTHLQMPGFIKETGLPLGRRRQTERQTKGPYLPGSALPVVLRMALARLVTPASNERIIRKIIYMREWKTKIGDQPGSSCSLSILLFPIFLKAFSLGGELKTTIFEWSLLFQVYLCNFFVLYCGSDMWAKGPLSGSVGFSIAGCRHGTSTL